MKQLQTLATEGSIGREAGMLRPFHNLKIRELKTELQARGVHIDQGMKKDQLQWELDDIFKVLSEFPLSSLLTQLVV